MANKRIQKKWAKQGGRKAGVPNLKKTDSGTLVNQHGVEFTQSEKRALEYAVNTANRKRARMLAEEAQLPRKVKGRETGDTVGSLQLMGKESDFIIAKRSKSLQRFKTKEDYNRYVQNLKRVNSPDYITERVRMYKRNHMKAIEKAFGDDAKDVVMKIRMMKPKDYQRMIQSEEMLEINYIYEPSARAGKLNQIRASLGMRLKEDETGEE